MIFSKKWLRRPKTVFETHVGVSLKKDVGFFCFAYDLRPGRHGRVCDYKKGKG